TQLARILTLRPRPSTYIEAREGDRESSTGSSMSFFSGHVASVAGVGAIMTYLEFLRHPGTVRPWLSLGSWGAGTVGMAVLRATARKHFVTDVIVAALVGGTVGTLVP